MDTATVAVCLLFGGVWVVAIVGIIANTITKSRSDLSRREAQEIRQRLAAVESRIDTLTQAVVGSSVISAAEAREIAEEAARLAEAQGGTRAAAAAQAASQT